MILKLPLASRCGGPRRRPSREPPRSTGGCGRTGRSASGRSPSASGRRSCRSPCRSSAPILPAARRPAATARGDLRHDGREHSARWCGSRAPTCRNKGVTWTRTSSSSEPAWPAWSPPPSSPTPGKQVLLLDQEPEQRLGGQAFWSLGGLFLVDTPEQRRMGIKDSLELALQDWLGSAAVRPRRRTTGRGAWAEAYVDFAAGEKRSWLHDQGHRLFPVVGWAERGDGRADGHGNSVPRFHLTWGTGPGVVEPFERRVREARRDGPGHASRSGTGSTSWSSTDGAVDRRTRHGAGARRASSAARPSNRDEVGDFELRRAGRDRHLRRHRRQPRPGPQGLAGAARHAAEADGRRRPGARRRPDARRSPRPPAAQVINPDRMWHYTEGIRNWDPIWENHGIRILPGPSSLWLDATGQAAARRRTSRASTPSARCGTSCAPATTTRGSC